MIFHSFHICHRSEAQKGEGLPFFFDLPPFIEHIFTIQSRFCEVFLSVFISSLKSSLNKGLIFSFLLGVVKGTANKGGTKGGVGR